jgi:hypothetical protein
MATIITNSSLMKDGNGNSNIDDDISFYALAYSYGSETVIAYRGTDNIAADLNYGWALGGGFEAAAPQGQMAIDFFNEVSNVTDTHMTLTGHSLGGGLAGYIGALYNKNAVLYDSMGYQAAANNNCDPAKVSAAA